jgi:hypothetical protein
MRSLDDDGLSTQAPACCRHQCTACDFVQKEGRHATQCAPTPKTLAPPGRGERNSRGRGVSSSLAEFWEINKKQYDRVCCIAAPLPHNRIAPGIEIALIREGRVEVVRPAYVVPFARRVPA